MPDFTPSMSVVVGTRNRPHPFDRFVKSLHATCELPTELIVADASDGFSDYPIRFFRQCDNLPKMIVLHEQPRLGMAAGYNAAFARATADLVVWFNDDCELLPGWQSIAKSFMDAHPEVGIGVMYWRDPGMEKFYVQQFHGMVYANFGVVRREVGNRVGWFGTAVRMYASDCQISFAIIDAGYACCQIPGCKVQHHREMDAERTQNLKDSVVGINSGQQMDAQRMISSWGPEGFDGFPNVRAKYQKFKHLEGPIYVE